MSGLRDITAAAEWLCVPRSWLRDAVTARRVQHTRIGRHVRFSEDDLASIVATNRQPALNP